MVVDFYKMYNFSIGGTKLGKSKMTRSSKSRRQPRISLATYDSFLEHPWISSLISLYNRDSIIAENAIYTLIQDIEQINEEYTEQHGRVLFTSVEGRVKDCPSFFKKFYQICCENGITKGITKSNLDSFYSQINDLAGVRFSCPYYDDVVNAIENIIRPKLTELGYATNLNDDNLIDKNYLDDGNDIGYRSYHFFLKIPTQIDIFGETTLQLCEVQGRTELQHVWAVKSHDLLYKPENGWVSFDENVKEDMKQLSNSLRAADQFIISIRDRVREE